MGEVDIKRQAPNVARMKMLGAEVRPATSGSKTLKDATNEAIRDWINNSIDTFYIIGSVVGPHPYPDMVARFQSVISKEIKSQLLTQEGKENPDYVIACVGGGSNAAGAFYEFLDEESVKLIAVEAAGHGVDSGESAATSILGKIGIIHGSKNLINANRRRTNHRTIFHFRWIGLSWCWATSRPFTRYKTSRIHRNNRHRSYAIRIRLIKNRRHHSSNRNGARFLSFG